MGGEQYGSCSKSKLQKTYVTQIKTVPIGIAEVTLGLCHAPLSMRSYTFSLTSKPMPSVCIPSIRLDQA
jgi:hypothetical protein